MTRSPRPPSPSARLLQPEPVKTVRPEREEVGQLADLWEARLADDLDRRPAHVLAQIQLERLHEAREVVDHQHCLADALADVDQHLLVLGMAELRRAAAEHGVLLAQI